MIYAARRLAVLLVLAALAVPAVTLAQSGSDHWEYRATIYGWVPNLRAKTEFPTGGNGPTITIDASTLVDNLDFTFMGAFAARKGAWGMFTDVMYTDLSHDSSGTRDILVGDEQLPGQINADLGLGMTSWVWTFAGTYEVVQNDRNTTDLVFGGRMLDIEQTLSWTINGDVAGEVLPTQTGSAKVSGTNWDAIIGLKGVAILGSSGHWFMPYYFDMGSGDSQFTWQAMAGVGYAFSWGDVVATYRYLDYQMDDGDSLQELSFYGPMIGASFAW